MTQQTGIAQPRKRLAFTQFLSGTGRMLLAQGTPSTASAAPALQSHRPVVGFRQSCSPGPGHVSVVEVRPGYIDLGSLAPATHSRQAGALDMVWMYR